MLRSDASDIPGDDGEPPADRTRAAAIDAFIAIVLETKRLPTAIEIARRVPCSLRTLFTRFSSLQLLGIAAFDKVAAQNEPSLDDLAEDAGRTARVRAILQHRASTIDAWLPMWRLAFQHDYVPDLRHQMERLEERWLSRFEDVFRSDLAALPTASRNNVLIALEAVTHPRVWRHLRDDRGLSTEEALRLWIEAVDRLFPRPDTAPTNDAAQ